MSVNNSKQQNDEWSAEARVWGEGFVIEIKTSGNEAAGEVPHVNVDRAVMDYLRSEQCSLGPGDEIEDPTMRKAVSFESEQNTLTVWFGGSLGLARSEFPNIREAAEEALSDEWEVANVEI